jgi:hypothetical protein
MGMGLYMYMLWSIERLNDMPGAVQISRSAEVTPTYKSSPVFVSKMSTSRGDMVRKDESVTLTIIGDSKGHFVEGFDVLLRMDGVNYEIESVTSEYFDVIKFPKKTHLSISAVKKLSTQSDIMLTPSVAALQIRLRPLADGQLRGVVIESIGPESSKMILTDDSSESGLVGVSAVVEE